MLNDRDHQALRLLKRKGEWAKIPLAKLQEYLQFPNGYKVELRETVNGKHASFPTN